MAEQQNPQHIDIKLSEVVSVSVCLIQGAKNPGIVLGVRPEVPKSYQHEGHLLSANNALRLKRDLDALFADSEILKEWMAKRPQNDLEEHY